jgi:hypothetical protein
MEHSLDHEDVEGSGINAPPIQLSTEAVSNGKAYTITFGLVFEPNTRKAEHSKMRRVHTVLLVLADVAGRVSEESS